MTRQEIEKAAFDPIDAPCVRDCDKCKDNYKNDCMWSIYRDGFVEGAKWRIRAIWHNPNDKPKDGEMILAICDNMPIICGPNNSDFEKNLKDFGIKRWAYVKDLMTIE